MKTAKNTKFTFEKMEVAKLENMKAIKGGQGGNDTKDNTVLTTTHQVGGDNKLSTGICS